MKQDFPVERLLGKALKFKVIFNQYIRSTSEYMLSAYFKSITSFNLKLNIMKLRNITLVLFFCFQVLIYPKITKAQLPVDENGWTVFTPSSDTRIYYC